MVGAPASSERPLLVLPGWFCRFCLLGRGTVPEGTVPRPNRMLVAHFRGTSFPRGNAGTPRGRGGAPRASGGCCALPRPPARGRPRPVGRGHRRQALAPQGGKKSSSRDGEPEHHGG